MPVCSSCFAYFVRAPCPYCANTGIPVNVEPRPVQQAQPVQTTKKSVSEEVRLNRKIESLNGKIDMLQKESQTYKEEVMEKNRVIAKLETEMRSIVEDKNFLLNRISELEGNQPVRSSRTLN